MSSIRSTNPDNGQNIDHYDPLEQHKWARDIKGASVYCWQDRLEVLRSASSTPCRITGHATGVSHHAPDHIIRKWYRLAVQKVRRDGEWRRLWPAETHPRKWSTLPYPMSIRRNGVRFNNRRTTHHAPGYWSLGDDGEVLVWVEKMK